MTAIITRVVTDQAGNPQIIIHPDDDGQLDSVPEFTPAGAIYIDLALSDYQGAQKPRDFLALIQPTLNAKSRIAGILCQGKIEAIDLAATIIVDTAAASMKIAQAIQDGKIPPVDIGKIIP